MSTWFCSLLLALPLLIPAKVTAQPLPPLGMVAPLEQDSLLYASGFTLLGETVGKLLSPSLNQTQFQANVQIIKAAKCKVYLCNVLFPGSIKLVGPQVDEKRILNYVDTVFYRANRAGIPLIVLGSGGSRRVPEGYDHQQAKTAFIVLCGKLAQLAQKHGITLVLESLNRTETNFLNTLAEAAEVVRKVNHPHFRLNADIYHMLKEAESPQHILEAGKIIVYVELAEKEARSLPGVKGEDFRPYLQALKTIGYHGPIVIEGRTSNLAKEAPIAHRYLTQQLKEVYTKRR